MRRVILDTDPGVDDAKAICLLLSQMETIRVEGITIVFGNHYNVDQLALNAKHIIELVSETPKFQELYKDIRIPIVKGAAKPIDTEYHGHSGIEVHGQDSLGEVGASYFSKDHDKIKHGMTGEILADKHAATFIIEQVNAHPHEVELIAIGPLTNIAMAVQLGLDVSKVKALYHMGGAFNERGNKTPVAEANIHNDPVAAKIVYAAGWPKMLLAPLNVTRQLCLRTSIKLLATIASGAPRTLGRFLSDISTYYIELLESWGTQQVAIHDSCAILMCTHPELFSYVSTHVDVETTPSLARGLTIADLREHYKVTKKDWSKNASIAMSVDTKAFYDTVFKLLNALYTS